MAQIPSNYPVFLRRAARPNADAALRLVAARTRPGEFTRSPGLGGLSATTAAPSTAGGILPVVEWSKCDAAVAEVWRIYKSLDAKVNGGWLPSFTDQSVARTALANMNARIKDWSNRLEVLKHGPVGPNALANPRQAIEDWKAWAAPSGPTSFYEWAKEIDATANFNSLWGMVKDVGVHTVVDTAKLAASAAQATGNAVMSAGKGLVTIVKYAPWIALVGGGVLVYLWGRNLTRPAGEAITRMSTAASDRIRGGAAPAPGVGAFPTLSPEAKAAMRRFGTASTDLLIMAGGAGAGLLRSASTAAEARLRAAQQSRAASRASGAVAGYTGRRRKRRNSGRRAKGRR